MDCCFFFFFKQKTAYEMRISDWSSDVCSSDLMQNAAGSWVQPQPASFQAAAATADWASSKDFSLVITNAPGADAWPITATNFILMYKQIGRASCRERVW